MSAVQYKDNLNLVTENNKTIFPCIMYKER